MYKADTLLAVIAGIVATILLGLTQGAAAFTVTIIICALINIAEHTKKISEKGGR
jgi:uncharacterized membrane protein YccC